jgi:hypothetical protein
VDYNQQRPHSSLSYLTPEEFARAMETGCGNDGGRAALENTSRFPPSHSPGDRRIGSPTVMLSNNPGTLTMTGTKTGGRSVLACKCHGKEMNLDFTVNSDSRLKAI